MLWCTSKREQPCQPCRAGSGESALYFAAPPLRRSKARDYRGGVVVVVVVVVAVVAIEVLLDDVDATVDDAEVVRISTHAMLPGGLAVMRLSAWLYERSVNCTVAPVVELV
jgi:hypothetical protein